MILLTVRNQEDRFQASVTAATSSGALLLLVVGVVVSADSCSSSLSLTPLIEEKTALRSGLVSMVSSHLANAKSKVYLQKISDVYISKEACHNDHEDPESNRRLPAIFI
jgi:hypothetical protein